jgi:hypothetical protein
MRHHGLEIELRRGDLDAESRKPMACLLEQLGSVQQRL